MELCVHQRINCVECHGAASSEELAEAVRAPDLFDPPPERRSDDQPSEDVFCDMGTEELFYIGTVQMPKPMPVEIVIEIQGWDYHFKLDHRVKSAS